MNEYKVSMRKLIDRLRYAGHKCTLLGVGPVSKTVTRAAFEACKRLSCPPIFIASRNQVDLKSLGYGYLMGGMDQKGFIKLIEEENNKIGYKGPVYICRDHGGPWQRNIELNHKYPVKKAMEIAKTSFKADIEAGFNYLHIDPTKCPFPHTLDDICQWTFELLEYCEEIRKNTGSTLIDYEVGTEDIQGGLTDKESFEAFIKKLTGMLNNKGLPLPTCVVGQTGTLTRSDCNIGHFDKNVTGELVKIAERCKVGFKEHNGDYLSAATCRIHPDLGITGINIAPEFGLIETDAYLLLANLELKLVREGWLEDSNSSHLRDLFLEQTFTDSPWGKWLPDNYKKYSRKQIESDSNLRLLIARVCSHYVYNDEEIKNALKILFKNINNFYLVEDAERFVLEKVRNVIEFYIRLFHMNGVNSIVLYQNN